MPFRQQPAFRVLFLGVILAATWIYDLFFQDGSRASPGTIALDLLLLFVGLEASLFFYSQFVLPVQTLKERRGIWHRLLLHIRHAHGPAIFIQNGRKIERRGEGARRGPGLAWIDTASAAVTRSDAGPKRVLGPGIHFLSSGERIESTFSMHPQTYSMGPMQDDQIFQRLPEGADENARGRFAAIQARRQMVSGLTRDGNEVIPEIRIVFRLEGRNVRPGEAGSRFGFAMEAVERAARSEGINVDPVSARRSPVAWNQLAGLIAVDLWREYLAKFTLDELFSERFPALPDVLQPEQPIAADANQTLPPGRPSSSAARLLWRINNQLAARLPPSKEPIEGRGGDRPTPLSPRRARQSPGRHYTALQIIAHMVTARMTQAAVPILDECGRCLKGHVMSEEYERLKERGIQVLEVSLGGYRFDPAVEQQIVQQWKTGWLINAGSERAHVEQLELLAAESGRQQALLEHAKMLGAALKVENPSSVPDALRSLLRATQADLLADQRLHGRGAAELGALSDLAKWVEHSDDE